MNILDINNYFFNPYALPPFLTCICLIWAMIFLYRAEGNTFISFSLLVMSATFFMWIFSDGMIFCSANEEVAFWWSRLCVLGVILLPVSCLQVFFVILGIYKQHRTIIRRLWVIASFFYLLSQLSSNFVTGLYSYWWGFYPSFGWLSIPFLTFALGVFAYSIYKLTLEYKKAKPGSLQQPRTRSCIVSFCVGCLGCIDYIAAYGVAFYPVGYLAILILLLLLVRTALRYRLNITPSFAAENIIDTMSDALIILAEDGTIALTNQMAERLLSLSKIELHGANLYKITDWEILRKNKQLAELCPINNLSVNLQKDDQLTPKYLELSISSMQEDNKTTLFVCLLRDVTQKFIAEQKLQLARKDLEQRVQKRTEELKIINEELQQEAIERNRAEKEKSELIIRSLTQSKLASLGEVATGIAHEINQPLSFIRIIFEATLKDLNNHKLSYKELENDCRESRKQVDRITAIINHLRTFGRGDDTEMQKCVALKDILDNTMILMSQRLKLKNITFTTHITDNLPPLTASPVRLEQVFINLLQNSIDALEDTTSPEISIDIYQHKNLVQIVFTDNGSGIPKKIREKIFEPFFTSKEVGKGTGLGLSIIYGIVREHQGTIELDCSNEKTSFIITLPIT